jgi:hypothetical protein
MKDWQEGKGKGMVNAISPGPIFSFAGPGAGQP